MNAIGGIARTVSIAVYDEITDTQWQQLAQFMVDYELDFLHISHSLDVDLDFLQHFSFLAGLNFGDRIVNVDGLQCLTDRMHWLGWNPGRKLSMAVLQRFPRLRVLAFGKGKDLDVIGELSELCWLSMDNTGLADLSIVTGLPHLRRVSMGSGTPPRPERPGNIARTGTPRNPEVAQTQ